MALAIVEILSPIGAPSLRLKYVSGRCAHRGIRGAGCSRTFWREATKTGRDSWRPWSPVDSYEQFRRPWSCIVTGHAAHRIAGLALGLEVRRPEMRCRARAGVGDRARSVLLHPHRVVAVVDENGFRRDRLRAVAGEEDRELGHIFGVEGVFERSTLAKHLDHR